MLPMVLLKGFAAQEHPALETSALRWNHTEKKKHLHRKEPTEGMTQKWPEALESSILLIFSNFTFFVNHWCGKRTSTYLKLTKNALGWGTSGISLNIWNFGFYILSFPTCITSSTLPLLRVVFSDAISSPFCFPETPVVTLELSYVSLLYRVSGKNGKEVTINKIWLQLKLLDPYVFICREKIPSCPSSIDTISNYNILTVFQDPSQMQPPKSLSRFY